tara:strand:+ start:195 stop:548 length:354 start_codon:yes stop_codon:yes gene_type:complete
MRIIFKNTNNTVGLLIPAEECMRFIWDNDKSLANITAVLKVIAEKDVPKDLPYKIVPIEDIPKDKAYRQSWKWDDSIEPDGFGGESTEFDAKLLKNYKGITEFDAKLLIDYLRIIKV